MIRQHMDQVTEELTELAKDEDAVMASRYLDKVPFEIGKAKKDISWTYDFLIARRSAFLLKLSDK